MKFFGKFRKSRTTTTDQSELSAVYEDLTALIVRWEDRPGGQKFADELHMTLTKHLTSGETLSFKDYDSTLPPALMTLDHEGAVGEVPTEAYLIQLRHEAKQRREDNARDRYYVS